ncbi:MAG: LptF/LptG family permease, partial [Planctomycetota bacterium]
MRVLQRAVLRETILLGGFYAAVYLALIVVGVASPMIKQGAPILSVLAFIPEQTLLLSMLALPLAMVTAFLGVIGRMREDGELTALMAAGVGTWQIAKTTLPVALVLATWMGISAHLILPSLSQRLMEGKSNLVQQALAAKVERRTPVFQDGAFILAAQRAEDDRLLGLFGVQLGEQGAMSAVYAPSARWVAIPRSENDPAALGLEMIQARLLIREPGTDPRVATAIVPSWSVRIPTHGDAAEQRADSMSTA